MMMMMMAMATMMMVAVSLVCVGWLWDHFVIIGTFIICKQRAVAMKSYAITFYHIFNFKNSIFEVFFFFVTFARSFLSGFFLLLIVYVSLTFFMLLISLAGKKLGRRIFHYIKTRNIRGATGQVAFDDNGDRMFAEYEVINVRDHQRKKIVGKLLYDTVCYFPDGFIHSIAENKCFALATKC